jgi:uncharacterized protein YwqG
MTSVLEAYKERDPVPNVKLIVDSCIRSNCAYIIKMNNKRSSPIIKNENYADPFIGKLKKISHVQSHHIKAFKKSATTDVLLSKFGGQPNWLTKPEWPLSQSKKIPMKFICQIRIDKEFFPNSVAEMAYIFMTEHDGTEETWEYFGGENAVILQPGTNDFIECQNQSTGISIIKDSFIIETETVDEPDYIPQDALSTLLSKKEEKAYLKQIDGNKIGGTPYFLQSEEYPGSINKWHLLLQLSHPPAKFAINFGDGGSGYVLLSEDGKRSVLTWQCF